MSETTSTASRQSWIRYSHRERLGVEYDVEAHSNGDLFQHVFKGELCYRIRTVRNISFVEEIHQPAYTMMPADRFLEVYEKAIT